MDETVERVYAQGALTVAWSQCARLNARRTRRQSSLVIARARRWFPIRGGIGSGTPHNTLTLDRLLLIVRDKLDAGTLPRTAPVKLWAGMGSGRPCTICEWPIMPAEPEYEPQFDDMQAAIRLHPECHRLWEAALRECA